MVEQTTPNGRCIHESLASELANRFGRTNSGAQQDPRCVDRAGAQHHAVGWYGLGAARPDDFDADHAPLSKEDPADQRVRADRELLALAHGEGEVRFGHAHAPSVDCVHRVRADAGLSRFVAVFAVRMPGFEASLDERALPWDPFLSRVPPDRKRSLASVPRGGKIEIAFEPNKGGQASFPRPFGEAEGAPLVEILRLPAQCDARVDGGRTTDDASAWERKSNPACARAVPELPIVFDHRVPAAPREMHGKRLTVSIVGARFDPEHLVHRL